MSSTQKPAHIVEHEAAMFARFRYLPVARFACPRVVAGTRCLGPSFDDDRPHCLCYEHHGMLDHARLWRDATGAIVLTAEPYDLADKQIALAAFMADCALLCLDVSVSADSPWYPGATTLLTVTRQAVCHA